MDPTLDSKRTSPRETWCAPAERASAESLGEMAELCLRNPVTRVILDSIDGFVLVLNPQRQILAVSPETATALNIRDPACLVGLRPGELFSCVHHDEMPAGCGTSRCCSTCGAIIAIMSSQSLDRPVSQECLLSVERNNRFEAHEFSVRATPLSLDDTRLTIFVLQDINAVKRRDVLETLFLHDLSNVIIGLQGWSELLLRRPQDSALIARNIVDLSERMNQEIQNQRLIIQAERGELVIQPERVRVGDILEGMKAFFTGYPPDKVHRLAVATEHADAVITTCPALLMRVLANMVKNAFEATGIGDKIQIWHENRDGHPRFVVHNPGAIPEQVSLQIFKRSFSTKGERGRGLGTYSMKLFGEEILGGEVGFSSSTTEGTSFFISLPGDWGGHASVGGRKDIPI